MIPESMAPDTIAATNVLPTFEVSLRFGATEAEIEARTGMTREQLTADDATVPADATYAHMELMYAKPNFARFLTSAAASHTLSSLGVVGLACKTVATVGQAMACHDRFQHLTNRTASYSFAIEGDHLVFSEQRFGAPRLGHLLVSDYAMLIAGHVIRQTASEPPQVLAMLSRRESLTEEERRCFADLLDSPRRRIGEGPEIRTGASRAGLVFERSLLDCPVSSADAELARYFAAILAKAEGFGAEDDDLRRRVRIAIRDSLIHGPPTAAVVAKSLGIGHRTLQRRLHEAGSSYGEVLESTRRTLAESYLRDRKLALAEIAYLLGYDEQTSFFRAFRRWYGQTPSDYRRVLRGVDP